MKKTAISILFVITLFLSSCVTKSTEISTHMSMRITKAYFYEYILPNNPDAKIEENSSYYKFLKRFKIKNEDYQVYLFAWELYEETDEWELIINDNLYLFEHEVNFIVFNNNNKEFYTVQEALLENLFTTKDFEESLLRLDIYIKQV